MLLTLENILGYRLLAVDGEIGKIQDFLLDDSLWRLRYLVVETGNWLGRRQVLVAPAALGTIDGERREFAVHLTRQQVETSPDLDTDQPVSRHQEMLMNAHYGWPANWSPEAMVIPARPGPPRPEEGREIEGDPHLRSFREISAYEVSSQGEVVARARDFVLNDADWKIESVVVAQGGWLDQRQYAMPADRIIGVSWSSRRLSTRLSKEETGTLAPFNAESPVNQKEKLVYFDYCGRPVTP